VVEALLYLLADRSSIFREDRERSYMHDIPRIGGIYHHVSKEHLHRYCEEFEYRYNSRKLVDSDRFALLLNTCNGRLTYKQLTKG
jgi:hypothetical protein